MSSTPSSVQDRDALLSVGHQCSEPSCMLVDFLPFNCQHCQKSFCGEHFLPAGHHCQNYDESKHNRVAPSCPLCNEIIAIPPGQDPNIRMEQHISTQCSVTTGKSGKSKSGPVCAKGRCGKVLFAPIRCDKCREQFCPQHRFPKDHNCKAPSIPPVTSGISAAKANALAKFNSRFNVKPSSMSTSTVKPTRKPTSPTTSNPPSSSSTSQASTSTSKPYNMPFSGTDRDSLSTSSPNTNTNTNTDADSVTISTNLATTDVSTPPHKPPAIDPIRARAERESRRLALQERARKGLLTEEEKATLAAEDVKSKDRKDNCSVM